MMDQPIGSFVGQMPFFEADRTGVSFGGGQTLGQAHLNDTLNNRDLAGMTMGNTFK